MPATRSRKRSSSRRPEVLQKPRGVIHPRVQKVGPEHFGIVSVDCAKARSKWMLCDFYGKVLVPPTVVEHNRIALTAATTQLRQVMAQHGLHDLIVAAITIRRNALLPLPASKSASSIPSPPNNSARPVIQVSKPMIPTWPPFTSRPSTVLP